MANYYNEWDPAAAQWIRNLIKAGLIPAGEVDERSIKDVRPDDLNGFTQCHFFCGLAGWPLALQRAGWPASRPVWSGSTPCQPFSQTGEGTGFADERHLWPDFYHLIGVKRPAVVVGEQVASGDAEPWLDLVHTDLEALGYAFGAVAIPSAGFGAPHIRDRTWWLGHTDDARLERFAGHGQGPARWEAPGRPAAAPGDVNGYWADAEWHQCSDGKQRAIKSGISPLAYGSPALVAKLRAAGNCINIEVAEGFIRAYLDYERSL